MVPIKCELPSAVGDVPQRGVDRNLCAENGNFADCGDSKKTMQAVHKPNPTKRGKQCTEGGEGCEKIKVNSNTNVQSVGRETLSFWSLWSAFFGLIKGTPAEQATTGDYPPRTAKERKATNS